MLVKRNHRSPERDARIGRNTAIALCTALLLVFAFSCQRDVHASGRRMFGLFDRGSIQTALANPARTLDRMARAAASLETLRLDLKFKHFKALEDGGPVAADTGDAGLRSVPALLSHAAVSFRVRVHRESPQSATGNETGRFTLAIELRGGESLFGLGEFSLREPGSRGYLADVVYQRLLARADNIAPRSQFVRLVVNGVDWGLMNLEERMGSTLLEVNRRRDQLIVKIAGGLDVYDAKRAHKNRAQRLAIPYVRQLAQSHRNGSAPVDEVFDLRRLTIALVVAEAFGSLRPLRDEYARYYFNPFTLVLEPIATDHAEIIRNESGRSTLFALAEDEPLRYRKYAELIVHPDFPRLLRDATAALEPILSAQSLHDEFERTRVHFPFYVAGEEETIARNFGLLRRRGVAYFEPTAVHARLLEEPPITDGKQPRDADSLSANPNVFHGTPPQETLATVGLSVDHIRHNVSNRSLNVHIRRPLVLPEGYGLSLRSGTRVTFGPEGSLVVRGPFEAIGRGDAPVVFLGDGGGGLFVRARAGDLVHIEHTKFVALGSIEQPPLFLTGAVTIYGGKTVMSDVAFEDIVSEDALNLVRTRFDITGLHVSYARSDAVDVDFSEGRIADASFADIGGDALDFSGSTIELTALTFDRIRDKAISIGEASNVAARHLEVRGVGAGIVVKDGSRATVTRATLSDCTLYGLMVYVKKPYYGTATLEAENLTNHCAKEHAVQRGSTLIVDGELRNRRTIDVADLYRNTVMRKQ